MLNITGSFSLKCDKCDKQFTFSPDQAGFEITGSEEKGMGPQLEHNWEHDFECENNGCDNNIEINYSVWEYPVGSFNDDEVEISNGKVVSKYQFQFSQ